MSKRFISTTHAGQSDKIASNDTHERQARLEQIVEDLLAEAKRQGPAPPRPSASSGGLETTSVWARWRPWSTPGTTAWASPSTWASQGLRQHLGPELTAVATRSRRLRNRRSHPGGPCAGSGRRRAHGQRDPGPGPLPPLGARGGGRHRPGVECEDAAASGSAHRQLRGRHRQHPYGIQSTATATASSAATPPRATA